jgi:C_GCAxxG_C_C family probable redox protein
MQKQQTDRAINSFNTGLNCAQSILSAYSHEFNFDSELALSISTGFGAGMGRLQETCGAVTGSFMVFGIFNSKLSPDNEERKERTYQMIQAFADEFKSLHGSIECKTMLNCDLQTKEGQRIFENRNLGKTVCEECISDSINIIEKLIRKEN